MAEFDDTKIDWDEYDHGRCKIFVPALKTDVDLVIFSPLSPKIRQTIEDVLSLPDTSEEKLKDLAWEECCFTFTVVDFGIQPPEGETYLDANLRHFGIHDASSAFEKLKIKEIQIEENESSSRFAVILMETAVGDLINVIVKNGEVVDFAEDGAYLGGFEDDDRYAQKQRQTTLKKYPNSGTNVLHNRTYLPESVGSATAPESDRIIWPRHNSDALRKLKYNRIEILRNV